MREVWSQRRGSAGTDKRIDATFSIDFPACGSSGWQQREWRPRNLATGAHRASAGAAAAEDVPGSPRTPPAPPDLPDSPARTAWDVPSYGHSPLHASAKDFGIQCSRMGTGPGLAPGTGTALSTRIGMDQRNVARARGVRRV